MSLTAFLSRIPAPPGAAPAPATEPPAEAPATDPAPPMDADDDTGGASADAAAVLDAPKEKRTRKRRVAPPEAALAIAPVAPAAQGPVYDPYVAPSGKPIALLLVNAFPMSGPFVDFSEVVTRAKALVNAEANVADYRFLDYGKGAGALSVAVAAEVAKLGGVTLCVDTRTPEGTIALSALIEHSDKVIRGY